MVGNSGSGKSTLGRAIAARLGVDHIELDALFHQANWTPLTPAQLRERVAPLVAADGWVIDGNYSAVRDLVWLRADTVVWLDLPRRTVMWRIVARTLRRLATRERLWNGNRERLRNVLSRDPDRNVVLWSWRKHASYRELYGTASRDPALARLRFVRITSKRSVQALLGELAGAQAASR